MNNDVALAVLRAYNGWRVDDPAYPDMQDPVEITQAIDLAIDALSERAEPVACEPEVFSYDPTEARRTVRIMWPDGVGIDYTRNAPPPAPEKPE